MNADAAFRTHVVDLLRRATDRSFEQAVADFPLTEINALPPHVEYTPWQLVEHLRIGQRDILEYIRDPHYVSPEWPAGYWPAAGQQADAAAWTRSLEAFRADREALCALVADPRTDLLLPMPHTPGHTVLREVFLVANHSAYHLGEFGILRQVMQTWPAGHDQ